MNEWLSELIARQETDSPPSDAEIDAAFRELTKSLSREIVSAQESPDSGIYGGLESRMSSTSRDLGKSVRAITSRRMWEIIGRLRENLPILDVDKVLIRLWLIGDAEAYIKEEQSIDRWNVELDRLRVEIESLSTAFASPENFQLLQALLTDAHNVVVNIARFHNERERVEHFERTMSDRMDDRARNTLADVLVAAYHARSE